MPISFGENGDIIPPTAENSSTTPKQEAPDPASKDCYPSSPPNSPDQLTKPSSTTKPTPKPSPDLAKPSPRDKKHKNFLTRLTDKEFGYISKTEFSGPEIEIEEKGA